MEGFLHLKKVVHNLRKQVNTISNRVSWVESGVTNTGSANLTPDTMDPEGVKSAAPGATYLNKSTNTLWIKATGNGNTGWV